MTEMNVLVLNSGTSTLKFQLITTDLDRMRQNKDKRLCRGTIEWLGTEAIISIEAAGRPKQRLAATLPDVTASLEYLLRRILASGLTGIQSSTDIDAIGHKVVHGGELFAESAVITDRVLKGIEECINLAPHDNPNNIRGIIAAQNVFGRKVPQVAVFDTSFHQTLPEHAYLYAVPYHLYERHRVRRYGFQGTSHRFVSERYRELRGVSKGQTNVITLHLGNACSIAAIRGGCSIDTSMGMTHLEGLIMGTRSGDLDPSVMNLIAAREDLSSHDVEVLLNTQSGLLGISGLTNDMHALLTEAEDHEDERARLAIEMFCYRARKYVGGFLACMGGADAIIFTGEIGENLPEIRSYICGGLGWTGLKVDENRNRQTTGYEGQITTGDSTLHAFVIPTDEELLIARDTVRCVVGEWHAQHLAA